MELYQGGGRRVRDEATILHIDMDAFYASASLIARPELRGKPVVIGAGPRSVVLSATYEARALGIHAAMPVGRARRLAPHAIFLEPDHELYADISASVMEVFRSFTPLVEPLSLDEAFLDVAGVRRLIGDPVHIAESIRTRIADEQQITCSVGIATTKFVAKIASQHCKPDGLLQIAGDDVLTFLHPLPVKALWGVGPKTEEVLSRLGLRTIADVAHTPKSTLERALGQSAGEHLHNLAWGRDEREVYPWEPEKSISAAETFGEDLDDEEAILRELLRLTERVTQRLRERGFRTRTIGISVRFADFSTISRSKTLRDATSVTHDIFETARSLYQNLHLDRVRVRLVSVRLENLEQAGESAEQLLLTQGPKWAESDQARDQANQRFGGGSVRPARLLRKPTRDTRDD